jgi:HD-like signal output (HDOD) protein
MTISTVEPPVEFLEIQADPEQQLNDIVMKTRDLPAMPQVASKVLELSSDPNTSAKQLQQIISDDQAMTARILKIANSAMYSCSRKVKTLTEAIVMLGFNSIRSLVVTSAARNLYNTKNSQTGLKERLLWEHSIGAAFACRMLVQDRIPSMAEEAFLAGLMHDIGKLVLNLRVPVEFDEIVQAVYNENRNFQETELALLGYDHTQVGALLVRKWNLSQRLEETILHHHNPAALTEDNTLLLYLDLANGLCKKLGIGFTEIPDLDLMGSPANRILALPAGLFDTTASRLQETLESEMEIFI